MRELPFFFVDVFADRPLAGNPLAVVADADDLAVEAMQALAREFNQSETTFVMKPTRGDADWRLRFFTTTGAEVYGSGHNALGAWWWLAHADRLPRGGGSTSTYAQEIGDRVLPVEVEWAGRDPRAVAMVQLPPAFGAVCDDRSALATALGVEPAELDGRMTPQVVSTGAAHLMVAVRDRAAVDRARPEVERLVPLVRGVNGQGCYVFALDTLEPASRAYARFFNPGVGISEDAATGSAAGPLAAYLRSHASTVRTLIVEQGFLMKRPSRIEVSLEGDRVRVFGRAVVVAEGRLRF